MSKLLEMLGMPPSEGGGLFGGDRGDMLRALGLAMASAQPGQLISPNFPAYMAAMRSNSDQAANRNALGFLLTQHGFTPEQAKQLARNEAIAKMAIDLASQKRADAAGQDALNNDPMNALFGGASPPAAPPSPPPQQQPQPPMIVPPSPRPVIPPSNQPPRVAGAMPTPDTAPALDAAPVLNSDQFSTAPEATAMSSVPALSAPPMPAELQEQPFKFGDPAGPMLTTPDAPEKTAELRDPLAAVAAAKAPPAPEMAPTPQGERALAAAGLRHWSNVMVRASAMGERGKPTIELAKKRLDLIGKYLEPTEIRRNLAAMNISPTSPMGWQIMMNALPDNRTTAERNARVAIAEPNVGREMIRQARAGATGQADTEYGNPPPEMVWAKDANGNVITEPVPGVPGAVQPVAVPVKGGKIYREEKAAEEQKKSKDENSKKFSNLVIQDIDRTIDLIDNSPVPVTGLGSLAKAVPGTPAHGAARLLDGIKPNIAFGRLQQMRDESKTGGALGAINQQELTYLTSIYGSLEQSQNKDQLVFNLKRLKNAMLDTIHGPGNGPRVDLSPPKSGGDKAAAPKPGSYRWNPKTNSLEPL